MISPDKGLRSHHILPFLPSRRVRGVGTQPRWAGAGLALTCELCRPVGHGAAAGVIAAGALYVPLSIGPGAQRATRPQSKRMWAPGLPRLCCSGPSVFHCVSLSARPGSFSTGLSENGSAQSLGRRPTASSQSLRIPERLRGGVSLCG